MGGFFDAALRTLPAIATSPYALVAYAGAVLAYVVLGWRVARNRNLLRSLEKVPVEDRSRLLRAEMNAVVPFRFRPLVGVEPELILGAVVAPSYEYDLYLDAGRSGYVARKSVAQEIKSRSTDHFLIRLATSQSANLDLSMTLSSVSHPAIWTSDVNLTTFVPRSDAKFARPAGQKVR